MSVSAADQHDFLEGHQSSRVPKVTATIRRTGGATVAASLPGHLAPVGKGMFSSGGPETVFQSKQRYKQKLPPSLFVIQSQVQGDQRGQRRRTAGPGGGTRRGGRLNGSSVASNGPEVPDVDADSTITMADSTSMVGPFQRPVG